MSVRQDYIAEHTPARSRLRGHMTWLGLGLCASMAGVALALIGENADAGRQDAQLPLAEVAPMLAMATQGGIPTSLAAAYADSNPYIETQDAEAEDKRDWLTLRVKPGDTLSGLFNHYGLPREDWMAMVKLDQNSRKLANLRTGEEIRIIKGPQGQVQELRYKLSKISTLQILRKGGSFQSRILEAPVQRRLAYAVGDIDSSMFEAARRAGLSNQMAMELSNVFGWDIDFALDIRSGDRFSVVYEELLSDGEMVGHGNIVAAEFINRNKKHQAFLYTLPDGTAQYFDADGSAMRKAFLRTPVDFARISSHFNLRRRHPILNRIRAHKGVDYAAPTGTPIKATGDGRVVFRGRKGGYGNVIILKHGSRYSTLYGHMSRFARGLGNGSSVKQGQVIGYVGSSGLATGPHLHYEFRVNDVHVNPLTVKIPSAEPLPHKYRKDYLRNISPLVAQLNTLADIKLAEASAPTVN